MSDWKFDSRQISGDTKAEAYGEESGVIHDRNSMAAGLYSAVADSTSDHHQAAASGWSYPREFTHLVYAQSKYGGVAESTKTGCIAHAKSAAGARMVKHYEANKDGRMTGMMKLSSSHSGPQPAEHPQDTITVVAGSSQISATYHRSSSSWSIYGSLYKETGVQTVNQQVSGFGNLNEEFSFNQAISKGSSVTIAAKTNDGNTGDELHISSAGSAVTIDSDIEGYTVLDTIISPDH